MVGDRRVIEPMRRRHCHRGSRAIPVSTGCPAALGDRASHVSPRGPIVGIGGARGGVAHSTRCRRWAALALVRLRTERSVAWAQVDADALISVIETRSGPSWTTPLSPPSRRGTQAAVTGQRRHHVGGVSKEPRMHHPNVTLVVPGRPVDPGCGAGSCWAVSWPSLCAGSRPRRLLRCWPVRSGWSRRSPKESSGNPPPRSAGGKIPTLLLRSSR